MTALHVLALSEGLRARPLVDRDYFSAPEEKG
jgi:hypothetical protein